MSRPTTIEVDRSSWPAGPWDGEPDRVEWRTAAGLPALIVRQKPGHLCGYVAVTSEHRWYACSYERPKVHVHGGLTYADKCDGPVCHVPSPGEPDDVWWFGFDAAHADDVAPDGGTEGDGWEWLCFGRRAAAPGEYRTVEFMRAHCESLAVQLVAVQLGTEPK